VRACVPLVLLTLLAASAASGASPRVTAKLVAATHDLSAGVPWSVRVQLRANGRALTRQRAVLRAHTAGPRLEEVLTEDNEASDKIAVIEMNKGIGQSWW